MRLRKRHLVMTATLAFALVVVVSASLSCTGIGNGNDVGRLSSSSSGTAAHPTATATTPTPSGSPFTSTPNPGDVPDATVPVRMCEEQGGDDDAGNDGDAGVGSVCDVPPVPHCETASYIAIYGAGPCSDAGRCDFTVTVMPCACVAGPIDAGDHCNGALGGP